MPPSFAILGTVFRRVLFALACCLPLIAIVLAGLSGTLMSRVEQARYTVLERHGRVEIRRYDPAIAAEVEVHGERMRALNQGFRLIADYIFGNNLAAKKVAMTAPVTQAAGEKIAMTAPVTQDGAGDAWTVRFVMPAAYTLETLPRPENPDVHLVAMPARKMAAVRFSGCNTDRNIETHRAVLLKFIAEHHLTAVGEPAAAFYNPPWTIPFLRRNEILVEIR
jgi:hypothetical protein